MLNFLEKLPRTEVVVTLTLLATSLVLHSPAFAWAAVASLLVELIGLAFREKLFAMKNISLSLSAEEKRLMTDLQARVTSIEYGIKQRGY